jgi:hypothetical protein
VIDLSHLRLGQLGFGVRCGLTLFLGMIAAGYGFGVLYIVQHVAQKDDDPELSWLDLEATYHGVDKPAPLLSVMDEPTHRAYLTGEKEYTAWVRWLKPDAKARASNQDPLFARYDPEDPVEGEPIPAEILQQRCWRCHATGAKEGGDIATRLPLGDWPSVAKQAYAKKLDPISVEILAVSSHTHFLSIPTFALLVFGLLLFTGWPRFVRHGLFAVGFLGLGCDFAGMWLARIDRLYLYLVVGGGGVFGACLGLALLALVFELWISPYLRGARQDPPT